MKVAALQLSFSVLNYCSKPVLNQIIRRNYAVIAALKKAAEDKMNTREELDKIATKVVLKVPEGEEVEMNSLWKDQRCVITYLRRQGALELSKIQPLLEAHNVRLIGIGLEELGVHEFIAGGFFKGEIYLDTRQEQYKALGFKKYNFCNIWADMFTKLTRSVAQKGRENKIQNNFKGNGFQSGGTLIVEKGGTNVILSYKMQALADHLENAKILEALDIKADPSVITTEPRRESAYSGHNSD